MSKIKLVDFTNHKKTHTPENVLENVLMKVDEIADVVVCIVKKDGTITYGVSDSTTLRIIGLLETVKGDLVEDMYNG